MFSLMSQCFCSLRMISVAFLMRRWVSEFILSTFGTNGTLNTFIRGISNLVITTCSSQVQLAGVVLITLRDASVVCILRDDSISCMLIDVTSLYVISVSDTLIPAPWKILARWYSSSMIVSPNVFELTLFFNISEIMFCIYNCICHHDDGACDLFVP